MLVGLGSGYNNMISGGKYAAELETELSKDKKRAVQQKTSTLVVGSVFN